MYHQMREYRERDAQNHDEAPSVDATPPRTAALPGYMSLAKHYGLTDMALGGSRRNEQSLSQEYQAYVTAALSPIEVDILKFWEVSIDISVLYCTHRTCRFIAMHFPLSLRWQWTTSRSRHLQYPANESFLQALKRIRKRGTVSAPF